MELINNLYYCGQGDVDTYIQEWTEVAYRKVAACERLMVRFELRLNKLNGVVG